MRRITLVAIVVALTSSVSSAQSRSSGHSPLDGVWKVAEVITTGANASTNTSPQPGLMIFSGRYYSLMTIGGDKPRPSFDPAKDPNNLTDAEKIARFEQWNELTANSGTYEIRGTTIIRHPMVAKNVTVMTPDPANPPVPQAFTVKGDTMWLTSKSAPGQPAGEARMRFTRLH